MTDFLQRDGVARIAVGIDIENTSKEGLESLLSLTAHGNIQIFIHHNEHQNVTFHPKVYLFSGEEEARLIIGSNNLTEAGLFTNTEAGLQVDTGIDDPVIVQMLEAIDSWCDTNTNLARQLDAAFLAELEAEGYVASEESLNQRRARSRSARAGSTGVRRRALFASRPESAPPPPEGQVPTQRRTAPGGRPAHRPRGTGSAPRGGAGSVLLMWPNFSRGDTQMQFPTALRTGPFFAGVQIIRSDHDGRERGIPETHPERDREQGKVRPNTYKFHVPEAHNLVRPVMRFWRTADGVMMYRVYDRGTADGQFIVRSIEEGEATDPRQTVVGQSSRGSDTATRYRFI